MPIMSSSLESCFAPFCGETIGIVKPLRDTMAQSWAVAMSAKEAAIRAFDEVMAAEFNHVVALTASTDTKFTEIVCWVPARRSSGSGQRWAVSWRLASLMHTLRRMNQSIH